MFCTSRHLPLIDLHLVFQVQQYTSPFSIAPLNICLISDRPFPRVSGNCSSPCSVSRTCTADGLRTAINLLRFSVRGCHLNSHFSHYRIIHPIGAEVLKPLELGLVFLGCLSLDREETMLKKEIEKSKEEFLFMSREADRKKKKTPNPGRKEGRSRKVWRCLDSSVEAN